jgi:hypothetical protein
MSRQAATFATGEAVLRPVSAPHFVSLFQKANVLAHPRHFPTTHRGNQSSFVEDLSLAQLPCFGRQSGQGPLRHAVER